jgi:peptide/nickel transport system substrate-binding protein
MIPPDSPWYNPDIEMYEHDPAKAQQMLEGLGYQLKDGHFTKGGEELELELIAEITFKEVGQFVEQQLEDIGINVDFVTLEGSTVDANVLNWQFDLSIYGHGGLYEPSILNKMIIGGSFNSARYHDNQNLNQLLNDQLHEMDYEARMTLVRQIQEVYADDLPALTLYYPDWFSAHDDSIELFYTSGGIASGVPAETNKMAFVEYQGR